MGDPASRAISEPRTFNIIVKLIFVDKASKYPASIVLASYPGSLGGGASEEEKESLVQTDPEHACMN